MDWDGRAAVAAALGPELRALATERHVVKDPQFLFTLGTWAAAGAAIEHVVLAMRSIDAVVDSRTEAGLQRNLDRDALANSLVYGVGLCLFAAVEHDIPVATVRFPDFLDDPEGLFAALPFPREVSYDEFVEVFRRVADRSNVRFGR